VPSRFHCSGEILPATLMIACATVMPSGWGHSGVAGVSGGVGSGPDGGTGVISADLSFSASDLVSRSIIAEESLHLAGWEWRITSVLISTMAGRRWQSSRRPAHRTRRRLNFVWDCSGWTYLLPELLADLNTGHNIVATVFEECRSMYRANGPVEMRPVGEVERRLPSRHPSTVLPCRGRTVRTHPWNRPSAPRRSRQAPSPPPSASDGQDRDF